MIFIADRLEDGSLTEVCVESWAGMDAVFTQGKIADVLTRHNVNQCAMDGDGVGVSHDLEPYLFADRRVDDLVGIFKNTTVGVFGGPRRTGIMLGVYF